MDKLNFQKAVDSLKNKDCTTNEKIAKFQIIEVSLSALQNHSNFKTFLSTAVQILLLFCEDNDSNCRISAEENLNRVIRNAEKHHQIALIQVDLYHEIKKNGNERSLRICLQIFSYYSHLIKHRRRKVYAQNLLPCMLSIGKRREILVIEAFTDYMRYFSKNLLKFLTDGELMKLVNLFISNLTVECAITRRSSAQNLISIIECTSKCELVINTVIVKVQENLCKCHESNTLVGTFGLLRLLMPFLAKSKHLEKILEIIESCLNILKNEQNHSIVNANLEVITALLAASENNHELKTLLIDDQKMAHKDILLSKRSMFIKSRKSSETETLKSVDFLQIPSGSSVMSTPNKSLHDFSDVEGDSFKSADFDVEVPSSPTTMRHLIEKGAESMSLKSTDSINSFFNTIASNSESVTKFFRKSSTESPSHQPKSLNESTDDRSFEISISQFKDENTDLPDSQSIPETAEAAIEDEECKIEETANEMIESVVSNEPETRDLYIGTIFDQSIVEYIVRLVSSKFLLDGVPKVLINDQVSRVSVKNVALSVINACVSVKCEVLLLKLQKDFTDESMMVERLLSFLIDEDLRLEEEETKRKAQGGDDANSSKCLEIKDDHFGECTTATFLDYFSPLSKNIDEEGLITLKNRIFEEKSKFREESAKKINRDLCQLLSRSEMSDSKCPLMETSLKMPEDKDCQFIADVLLFATHNDPVLRSNAYTIAGSFLKDILRKNFDYEKFISRNEILKDILKSDKLIKLITNGFYDEAHTVVKQTLVVTAELIEYLPIVMSTTALEDFIEQLFIVFMNKYWLVQCTYADVLTKINCETLRDFIGATKSEMIQNKIFEQLFELIKDNDFRVRNHVSTLLPEYMISLCNQSSKSSPPENHMKTFVLENVMKFDSFFFDMRQQSYDCSVEKQLTKVLYEMANFLMDIKDKNQLFGVIHGLKVLTRKFSPIDYPNAWKEFNVLNVLLSFLNKNPIIALDVSCQCDMIEIVSSLIGALSTPNETQMQTLTLHIMKILNIYAHLINNTKPLIVPKNKSSDLFTTSKELAIINSLGFFGADHIYLKLFVVLKSSFESFRMTINQDAETKLRQLLHNCLKSLQTIFEMRTMSLEHVKFVEETVLYLTQIMTFQPEDCIVTAKILLKFLFKMNFINRKIDIDTLKLMAERNNTDELFEKYEKFSRFDMSEFALENNIENLIKQLDPLVIQVLRLFSKSSANLQATIVSMLCQLMEFNVNYMQLDAKKVFVELVMRHMDYIESGLVMNGEILAPLLIQFLIFLTKLKEKKIITVPKIINIIDNLLAMSNPNVKDCGVEALFVLTTEVFFKKNRITGDAETIEAAKKDINAQREVVVSMLLKFLHRRDVQQRLCWILAKSRIHPNFANVINEAEIHQQLIECMQREREVEYQLIGVISKNILLESKSFEQILALYWETLENGGVMEESSLKFAVLIQEQVFSKSEEFYLMNHIKLHQEKREIEDDEPLKTFVSLHQKFLMNAMASSQPHRNIRKLLRFMGFKKLSTLSTCLHNILNVNEILKASSTDLNNFESFVQFLLWTDVNTEEILKNIKSLKYSNTCVLLNIFFKHLFIKKNDINGWENQELMDLFKDAEHLDILLKFSKNVLLDNLMEDEKISKIILKKLSLTHAPFSRVKYLIENSQGNCLIECLNFIISESVKDSKDARKLQLVASKKLHLLKNDIFIGKESVRVSLEDVEKVERKLHEFKLNTKFPSFTKSIEDFLMFLKLRSEKNATKLLLDDCDLKKIIDESWFLSNVKHFIFGSEEIVNSKQIAQVLFEIKSEMKLAALMTHNDFNVKLLPSTIDVGFNKMLTSFRVDCIQINPHLNYMKISPLLKTSILILMKKLDVVDETTECDMLKDLSLALSIYFKWITKIYNVSLIYVEAKNIEKFIGDNLLKSASHLTLIKFSNLLLERINEGENNSSEIFFDVLEEILTNHQLWSELDDATCDRLVRSIYKYLEKSFEIVGLFEKYQHPHVFDALPSEYAERVEIAKNVIFIARFQENFDDGYDVRVSFKVKRIVTKLLSISRILLRSNKFYQFAITPYEILLSYRSGDDLLVMHSTESSFKLKQIPIEYLSDSELLEKYIRRINRYGFTQRQQFEEVFMTLLVELNQWNEMHDAEERFRIKQLCLQMNVDLIASCYRFPNIGFSENSFFHFPRYDKMNMESVGIKKLHHIQNALDEELNVFYQSNLERIEMGKSNVISSSTFEMNQLALNHNWQMIESRDEVAAKGSMLTRNVAFYHERAGVDFKSALQLIYDLITQMIDENFVIVLPQLAKLIDLLDNADQFKWINKKMWSLHESIAEEDTISHQYVAYLLCRSSAVLVPTLSEIQQLVVVINKYLGCNQIFVRIAALHGLLCLFECVCKTNTTLGAMSDEMKLLKNCIIIYTNKNGIAAESSVISSKHDKLVWSLNFYVIEMTSKFAGDCDDLVIDSIISANNTLKRTSDFKLFHLILNGLERLVILNPRNKMYREKVEKLSLDLMMKSDNKLYSTGGLKLLVTCLYIGSLEQLENTEKSNGIVQDEPEILMQSTEKIEILFSRIRTATVDEAETYGRVLGQILKDLLPPNEILTKVVKELLIMNQSNCVCIAEIIHQVFRSAIDSSYLTLLQEFLICSLSNFLSYPNSRKSVWFLSIIFLSSTLNQHLLKLFPILLDENIEDSILHKIFLVTARDFNEQLSKQQRIPFKEAFENRIKTKMMSSSACSISPTNSFAYNNNLFTTLLKHL